MEIVRPELLLRNIQNIESKEHELRVCGMKSCSKENKNQLESIVITNTGCRRQQRKTGTQRREVKGSRKEDMNPSLSSHSTESRVQTAEMRAMCPQMMIT